MGVQDLDDARPNSPTVRHFYAFSLLNMLLGSALLVTVISHVVASRQLGALRADVKRLRSELGYLSIADPSKCYVSAYRQLEPGRFVFHVYLPQRHRYVLKYSMHRTSKNGDDKKINSIQIMETGESTLFVNVFRDQSLNPQVRLRWGIMDTLIPLGADSAFASPSNFSASERVSSYDNTEFPKGSPIKLLTSHAMKEGDAHHRDVFELWLEEEPEQSN